jgi:hypothetical protein
MLTQKHAVNAVIAELSALNIFSDTFIDSQSMQQRSGIDGHRIYVKSEAESCQRVLCLSGSRSLLLLKFSQCTFIAGKA